MIVYTVTYNPCTTLWHTEFVQAVYNGDIKLTQFKQSNRQTVDIYMHNYVYD